jgi:hypothetical protein
LCGATGSLLSGFSGKVFTESRWMVCQNANISLRSGPAQLFGKHSYVSAVCQLVEPSRFTAGEGFEFAVVEEMLRLMKIDCLRSQNSSSKVSSILLRGLVGPNDEHGNEDWMWPSLRRGLEGKSHGLVLSSRSIREMHAILGAFAGGPSTIFRRLLARSKETPSMP